MYRASIVTGSVHIPVALKPIKSLLLTEKDVDKFLKEISILKCIQNPNIAQVYGLVDKGVCMVIGFFEGGTGSSRVFFF